MLSDWSCSFKAQHQIWARAALNVPHTALLQQLTASSSDTWRTAASTVTDTGPLFPDSELQTSGSARTLEPKDPLAEDLWVLFKD